jgi:hypothetical protein
MDDLPDRAALRTFVVVSQGALSFIIIYSLGGPGFGAKSSTSSEEENGYFSEMQSFPAEWFACSGEDNFGFL